MISHNPPPNASKRDFLVTLAILISLLSLVSYPASSKTSKSQTQTQTAEQLPLDELRSFSEVFYYVKSAYVDEIDDKALINAAIKGMVSSLDSHSRYLDPADFANFNADNNGEYAGIGLSFTDHAIGIQINHIVANSPSDRQGLTKGLVVYKINGIDIKEISAEDAYKLLTGKVNSTINLSVVDPVSINDFDDKAAIRAAGINYSLNREIIYLPSVTSNLLPTNIGYLAISQFTKKTTLEFIDAVNDLSVKKPLEKLIIDLRDNPGGVLESAVQISDLFIDSGTLLTSTGRVADANETFSASSIAPFMGLHVVIMMNAYSASSSEILAAALQDHKHATILGDVSYGKGSIQSIYYLRHSSGLKITTAKYFSPNGHKIQDVGIKPDVLFKTAGLENHEKSEVLDDLEVLQAFKIFSKPTTQK